LLLAQLLSTWSRAAASGRRARLEKQLSAQAQELERLSQALALVSSAGLQVSPVKMCCKDPVSALDAAIALAPVQWQLLPAANPDDIEPERDEQCQTSEVSLVS